MEFKLNKIDTDIRKKMQEERKDGKIHFSKGINVNKDLNDGKENNALQKKESVKSRKRFIIVDGIKYNSEKIKVAAEKTEGMNVLNSTGQILDITK